MRATITSREVGGRSDESTREQTWIRRDTARIHCAEKLCNISDLAGKRTRKKVNWNEKLIKILRFSSPHGLFLCRERQKKKMHTNFSSSSSSSSDGMHEWRSLFCKQKTNRDFMEIREFSSSLKIGERTVFHRNGKKSSRGSVDADGAEDDDFWLICRNGDEEECEWILIYGRAALSADSVGSELSLNWLSFYSMFEKAQKKLRLLWWPQKNSYS